MGWTGRELTKPASNGDQQRKRTLGKSGVWEKKRLRANRGHIIRGLCGWIGFRLRSHSCSSTLPCTAVISVLALHKHDAIRSRKEAKKRKGTLMGKKTRTLLEQTCRTRILCIKHFDCFCVKAADYIVAKYGEKKSISTSGCSWLCTCVSSRAVIAVSTPALFLSQKQSQASIVRSLEQVAVWSRSHNFTARTFSNHVKAAMCFRCRRVYYFFHHSFKGGKKKKSILNGWYINIYNRYMAPSIA